MIAHSSLIPSFANIMMAVFATNALMILISLCLANEKLLVYTGHRLLALLVLFTILRFLLPIELPFTITLKHSETISLVIAKLHDRLFYFYEQPISLWEIIKLVWFAGFLIGVLIHLISCYRSNKYIILYGKELTHTAPYKELLTDICKQRKRPNHFRVIELPGLEVPVLFGILHPRILLPENLNLSDQELSYILQHEVTHHFNHDILFKNIIQLISLVYWWDIFSWLLRKQCGLIQEMRIDNSVTCNDTEKAHAYMHCLIDMYEHASLKQPISAELSIGILSSGRTDMRQRFNLMLNKKPRNHTFLNVLTVVLAITIYISSYLVIWEGFVAPESYLPYDTTSLDGDNIDNYVFPTADNSYFIDNLDGTYDLYMNNDFWETVDSLEYYYDDIPIYTADTIPQ